MSSDDDATSPVNQLRLIVEQASLVDFTAILQEIELSEEVTSVIASATDVFEEVEAVTEADEGAIEEHDVEGFLNWYNGFQEYIFDTFGNGLLGGFLSLLVTIVFLPILLPIGIIFAISVWLAFLRRPFEGGPFMKSTIACEAELMTCEFEAFLLDSIPTLLKESFIAAGTSSF